MKKILKNLLLILLVFFILSFFAYKFYWTRESKRVSFSQERKYSKSPDLIKFYHLNFEPAKIREINDSVLLIEDLQENKLVLFNKFSNKLSTYFEEKGDTAKNHKLIEGIDIDNSRIFVSDSKKKQITAYDLNGTIYSYDSINFDFARSIKIQGDSIFLFQRSITKNYRPVINFATANIKTSKVIKDDIFNNVFNNEANSDMINDGFLVNAGKVFFYICYQVPQFFCFDKNMVLLYKANLIYNTPNPVIKNLGRIRYVESSYIGVTNATFRNDSLFILSNIGDKSYKDKRIVDIYKIADGKYVHSFVAPNEGSYIPTEIYKGRNYSYFVYKNGFGCFKN
ncbi:hypothetical protein [Parafilimonas sp.]|uniref:hypothetical protein n=1 Tax=Parafilimonas sp. TaxID=1969739 RepID=UPI003F7DDB8A